MSYCSIDLNISLTSDVDISTNFKNVLWNPHNGIPIVRESSLLGIKNQFMKNLCDRDHHCAGILFVANEKLICGSLWESPL